MKTTVLQTLIFLWVIYLFGTQPGFAQKNPVLTDLSTRLENYYRNYPQQKVYLHLDKQEYQADETVWFKAYLTDATSHQPDLLSTNLYVDLMNPSGNIVQTRILKLKNGFAHGDFSFRDTVPEGIYRIVSYTNWMKNFGSAYFFSTDIYVANPYFAIYATRDDVKNIKKAGKEIRRESQNIDVQFLPEGGNLLEGVANRIAFKALNEAGGSVEITGRVVDHQNNEVLTFQSTHKGMGSFYLTPAPRKKYYAVISLPDGSDLKIALPEAMESGVSLKIETTGKEELMVSLNSNSKPESFPLTPTFYLLAHTRGKPLYSAELVPDADGLQLSVPKKLFPAGVTHFTLFNRQLMPVSERLVFINDSEALQVIIDPSSTLVKTRQEVSSTLKVLDSHNHLVAGNFSVSVSKSSGKPENHTVQTHLLLTSDLRGEIEDPLYYFTEVNEKKETDIDHLMLTQGWRRFNWTNVTDNLSVPPLYREEKGLEIAGKITKEFFNIPLEGISVRLTVLNAYNDIYTTRSRSDGTFIFDRLDYPDTLLVRLEAERENGRKNLLIYLDERVTGKDETIHYYTRQNLTKRGPEGRYTPPAAEEESDPFEKENNERFRIHQVPKDVIILDDHMRSYTNIAQIIQSRVAGVYVSGNNIRIRGSGNLSGNTDPLFLLDGTAVDKEHAMSVSPYEIERIEILKGPEAAVYGIRGANGVVAIYTRRGRYMIKGILEFKMLGYHTPKEFYTPVYRKAVDDIFEDDRRTIFWSPNLTTDPTQETLIRFITSDIPGNYSINLQGISKDGKPACGTAEFTVVP
jgi:TonB-dependent SusC/RagA subfamily outer membrane receptor